MWVKQSLSIVVAVAVLALPVVTAAQANDQALKRIQERKTAAKLVLDKATAARTTARCQDAQKKLVQHRQTIVDAQAKKVLGYQSFIDTVARYEQALSAKNMKSSQLLSQIAEARKLYDTLAAAQQKLADASADAATMDCKADPTGFVAALTEARTSTKSYLEAQKALNVYLKQTLKPTVQAVKDGS